MPRKKQEAKAKKYAKLKTLGFYGEDFYSTRSLKEMKKILALPDHLFYEAYRLLEESIWEKKSALEDLHIPLRKSSWGPLNPPRLDRRYKDLLTLESEIWKRGLKKIERRVSSRRRKLLDWLYEDEEMD